jgi:hypothetical protein
MLTGLHPINQSEPSAARFLHCDDSEADLDSFDDSAVGYLSGANTALCHDAEVIRIQYGKHRIQCPSRLASSRKRAAKSMAWRKRSSSLAKPIASRLSPLSKGRSRDLAGLEPLDPLLQINQFPFH